MPADLSWQGLEVSGVVWALRTRTLRWGWKGEQEGKPEAEAFHPKAQRTSERS